VACYAGQAAGDLGEEASGGGGRGFGGGCGARDGGGRTGGPTRPAPDVSRGGGGTSTPGGMLSWPGAPPAADGPAVPERHGLAPATRRLGERAEAGGSRQEAENGRVGARGCRGNPPQ